MIIEVRMTKGLVSKLQRNSEGSGIIEVRMTKGLVSKL